MENLKFTKEYAEKLAVIQYEHINESFENSTEMFPFNDSIILQAGFEEGYMKAIEETAAPELLEALIYLINDLERNDGDLINRNTLIIEAKNAINKATK